MNIEEAIKILYYKIDMYKEDVFIGNIDKTNIEAIQLILNEIERLEVDYSQANDIIVEQSKKIERLNNGINELEKYLWEERYNHQGEYVYTGKRKVEDVYTMILDKIKELVGSENDGSI